MDKDIPAPNCIVLGLDPLAYPVVHTVPCIWDRGIQMGRGMGDQAILRMVTGQPAFLMLEYEKVSGALAALGYGMETGGEDC